MNEKANPNPTGMKWNSSITVSTVPQTNYLFKPYAEYTCTWITMYLNNRGLKLPCTQIFMDSNIHVFE